MLTAKMVKDEYVDLVLGYPYEVERMFSQYAYVQLKGSPRRYDMHCFEFYLNGEKISAKAAYRWYRIERVKAKFGMK